MHRPLVALLLAACTMRNPAFDEQDTAPGSSPADTTAGTVPTGSPSPDTSAPDGSADATADTSGPDLTSTSSDTGVGPTSVPQTTTDPTVDPDTTDTTGSSTLSTTDATTDADLCMGVQCGECSECMNGTCVARPPQTPCQNGDLPSCDQQVFGLVAGKCVTYQPVAPACDGQGQCVFTCQLQGPAFVQCSESCVSPMHNCYPGALTREVSLASLCFLGVESPGCNTFCNLLDDTPYHNPFYCDGAGQCEYKPGMQSQNCFPGSCVPEIGCQLDCMTNQDCSKFAQCMGGTCVYP